jgi:hypothetical protein
MSSAPAAKPISPLFTPSGLLAALAERVEEIAYLNGSPLILRAGFKGLAYVSRWQK